MRETVEKTKKHFDNEFLSYQPRATNKLAKSDLFRLIPVASSRLDLEREPMKLTMTIKLAQIEWKINFCITYLLPFHKMSFEFIGICTISICEDF